MTAAYPEIGEVISYIHDHLYEPLSLDRLANVAAYSPYHFSRLFKEQTGLSPLYYVSALRLQKAKDLLLNTNLTVRDIGMEIGQQSVGTFTTRFTERVGMTPAEFRKFTGKAENHLNALQKLNEWSDIGITEREANPYLTIQGTVKAEAPFDGVILIGLFAKPIPEGLPLYGTLLPSLGQFCFPNVQPGIYYLMATSVPWGMQPIDFILPYQTLRTRTTKPIIVGTESMIPHQDVMLRAPRFDDPPILISLPLLMKIFLNRVTARETGS